MHDKSIVEMLQKELERIPLDLRHALRLGFDVNKGSLDKNIVSVYQITTSRLRHLDYYLQWSRALLDNSKQLPEFKGNYLTEGMPCSFNDVENMNSQETLALNNSFSKWINNRIVRDLDEFLQYYLLAIYEICLVTEYTGCAIYPRNVIEIKEKAKEFESSSLKDRLKNLRNNYNIDFTHKAEVYSLNKIRQIFSHFDGIVENKFCNKENILVVKWPTNTITLKHRKTGKTVPFDKVPKPFNKDYGHLNIKWLNKPKIVEYKHKEKIELSDSDINQLFFFYLYVFNELQRSLHSHIKNKRIKIRSFRKYELTPTICLVEEEKKKKANP